MSVRNILITGGCGFIGSNMVHYWNTKYPDDHIIILDKMGHGSNLSNLNGVPRKENVTLIKGNIGNTSLVSEILFTYHPFSILNFAAETHVDRSISSPESFIQTNVEATFNLLEAVRKYTKQNKELIFLHVSTDEVYGSLGPYEAAFTEKSPYRPNSPYSASKASSDHLVRAYHHTYGLQVITTNCSNNYGPLQATEKFIPLMITNALGGRDLPVYGNGRNIRDWLYVKDHCNALDFILFHGQVGETYNIGGSNERSNLEVLDCILSSLAEVTGCSDSSMLVNVSYRSQLWSTVGRLVRSLNIN